MTQTNNTQPILAYMLFVLFLWMKLTGQIAWSWWWVFAPLWGYPVLLFVVAFAVAFVKSAGKAAREKGELGR